MRDYKETIKARLNKDPQFKIEMIKEIIKCIFIFDFKTAKNLLMLILSK